MFARSVAKGLSLALSVPSGGILRESFPANRILMPRNICLDHFENKNLSLSVGSATILSAPVTVRFRVISEVALRERERERERERDFV